MEMKETLRKMNLEMALSEIVGDGGKRANQVTAEAKQRYADNPGPYYLGPDLIQEYSENDCICDSLEKAIWDEYFGRMSREAAIAIRDTLKYDGRICISQWCPKLTLDGRGLAIGWNERHKDDPIDIYYTGYIPFEN